MDQQRPPIDQNPYQSPQAASDPLPAQRVSTLRAVVATLLIIIVSPIAFCCVCFPIGAVGFGAPNSIGPAIMVAAWIAGALAGIGVGWLIYRWLIGRRKAKDVR